MSYYSNGLQIVKHDEVKCIVQKERTPRRVAEYSYHFTVCHYFASWSNRMILNFLSLTSDGCKRPKIGRPGNLIEPEKSTSGMLSPPRCSSKRQFDSLSWTEDLWTPLQTGQDLRPIMLSELVRIHYIDQLNEVIYFKRDSIASKNKGAISGVGVFTAQFTLGYPTLQVSSTRKGMLGGTLPER